MAASSSSSESSLRTKRFAIFLSHSGKQKLFTHVLYETLTLAGHKCFFDQDSDHSLRIGDDLSVEIQQAIQHCELAVVVISHEFITSSWPMKELHWIMKRKRETIHGDSSTFRIYPIFYRLAPADLTEKHNLEPWKQLQSFDIAQWVLDLAELREIAGSVLPEKHVNEFQFIKDTVFPEICKICPAPPLYYGNHSGIFGQDIWVKEIEYHFDKIATGMNFTHIDKVTLVLGIHGIGGCGKTTLCKTMVDHYTQLKLPRMCGYLLLPTHFDKHEFVEQLIETMHQLGLRTEYTTKDIDKALNSFIEGVKGKMLFLAIDNVCSWSEGYVLRILMGISNQGSYQKVIVTSRAEQSLQTMFLATNIDRGCYKVVPMPSIRKEAALDVFLFHSRKSDWSGIMLDKVNVVVDHCLINGCYYPLILIAIASKLKKTKCNKGDELDKCIKFLKDGRTLEVGKCNYMLDGHDVLKVLNSIFTMLDEELQSVFLDVTLFVLFDDEFKKRV